MRSEKNISMFQCVVIIFLQNFRLRIITRTEPVSKINEHALVQVGTGDQTRSTKLTVANALAAITAGTDKKVAKNLKKAQKKKQTLDAPLEKPQALRVKQFFVY